LTHNYWGVLLSLIVSGFPFVFLLMLSYVSGIDPVLGRAAATLGASPWRQFPPTSTCRSCSLVWRWRSACVRAGVSVFPSAVLLGAPPVPRTRVILDRGVRGGVEQYDYSRAS